MYKTKIDNLDLKQIADSGQCFRWKNTGENEYTVVAFDRALRIKQDGNEFELDCDEADWNNIWKWQWCANFKAGFVGDDCYFYDFPE